MFGLVFSNNLVWVFFFWEITTLCSFLLIGYSETEEATNNSFLALWMNLLGGVAFIAAIIYLVISDPSGKLLGLNYLITTGKAIALVPAVLICFAGITKAALMPFSSWLTGAMVAPTPVSALLHSSTMVKAGVYIIVRFAPVLTGTPEGLIISLIGGMTFLLASFMAISQNNAKKVLAYSTIANLGLIVACAGVGTYNLIWVAILLIIFHATAKSLLFLCVGTIEQRIGSRNIEDMGGLIVRMPKLAVMMFIGMAGMFLAPFGMVISKWAAIEAFITAPFGLIFIAILVFGGSVTVFFWSKWMGKIISVMRDQTVIEDVGKKERYGVLYILTGLVVFVCLIFPLISSVLIEPFVMNIYGETTRLAQANLTIMLMMLCLLMIMPFSMLFYRKGVKPAPPYMGGRPMDDPMKYTGSMGVSHDLVLSNYYLKKPLVRRGFPWSAHRVLGAYSHCLYHDPGDDPVIPEPFVPFLYALVYILIAPLLGGLIAGIDRKVTARMQGRVGPPLLQPFYDVGKFFEKENLVVTTTQNFYALSYLVFMAVAGALFFSGGDMLLVIFAFTLSHIFLVLGAYASFSPYSHVGAERELIQIIAYEPMIIITAVGMYMVTRTFYVGSIVVHHAGYPVPPGRLHRLSDRAHYQTAEVPVRSLHVPPCAPGDCQGSHDRFRRPEPWTDRDRPLVRVRLPAGGCLPVLCVEPSHSHRGNHHRLFP